MAKLDIIVNFAMFNKKAVVWSELIPTVILGANMPYIYESLKGGKLTIALAVTALSAAYAVITPLAAGAIVEVNRARREMPGFLTETQQIKPYRTCTGKTNTGNETVILTSHYYNDDEDADERRETNRKEARMMMNYLTQKKFLGYNTGIVHVEDNAQPLQLEAAIKDSSISSVVLIGHSRIGSWTTTTGNIGREDVSRWVNEAGHCKNGFGMKAGCNVIQELPQDDCQMLAPAYSHSAHPGELVIVKGHRPKPNEHKLIPEELNNQLPTGMHSEITYGIETDTRLIRLKASQG
ncbi:hypothetical protein HYU12_02400 [Candidatus Woesearchaeota archaeon]|nr:hypothetical protein [Candidatus Woesearchaeota archaeon]